MDATLETAFPIISSLGELAPLGPESNSDVPPLVGGVSSQFLVVIHLRALTVDLTVVSAGTGRSKLPTRVSLLRCRWVAVRLRGRI